MHPVEGKFFQSNQLILRWFYIFCDQFNAFGILNENQYKKKDKTYFWVCKWQHSLVLINATFQEFKEIPSVFFEISKIREKCETKKFWPGHRGLLCLLIQHIEEMKNYTFSL
jgi:hypothetical protein